MYRLILTTVLSTSLGKTCFAWRFTFMKNFVLIDHILSVSVFCSQVFTLKLNLQLEIGPASAISVVK